MPAKLPAQCRYIRPNGVRCGSPALKGKTHCYFHYRFLGIKTDYYLPALEDANSIQMVIMQVVRGVMEDGIDVKKAGLVLYAMQIASQNLHRVNFQPEPKQMVLEVPLLDAADDKEAKAQTVAFTEVFTAYRLESMFAERKRKLSVPQPPKKKLVWDPRTGAVNDVEIAEDSSAETRKPATAAAGKAGPSLRSG